MKKIILAIALILPFVFQSCKNDRNNEISLAGTEWECLTDDNYRISLKFPDDRQFVITYYELDYSITRTVDRNKLTVLDSNTSLRGGWFLQRNRPFPMI